MDSNQTTVDYSTLAREVRKDVLSLIHKGQTSHVASCFSATDIAVVLYENLKDGDEVIFSKGWASALYYVMEIRRGNLNREEVFNTFPNEPYGALLEPPHQPVPTGSVGHGLSVAVGIAYAKKLSGEPGRVYCLMSDGELNEGTFWEAKLLTDHLELKNLTAIIDANGWQAMGRTKDVIKIPSQGIEIDGHDYKQIEEAIRQPCIITAHTIKGKGVKMFEDKILYHYKHVDKETYEEAIKELNA